MKGNHFPKQRCLVGLYGGRGLFSLCGRNCRFVRNLNTSLQRMSNVQGNGRCLFGGSLESRNLYGVGEKYSSLMSTSVILTYLLTYSMEQSPS